MPLMSGSNFLHPVGETGSFLWGTGIFTPPSETQIYECTIANTSAFASLSDQPFVMGMKFDPGVIPNSGGGKEEQQWRLVIKIDGVPSGQISRRTFHEDGSLSFCSIKLEVDELAAGATSTLTFWKSPGNWDQEEVPLHSSLGTLPEAEWEFTSWRTRPTTSTYGSELGPYVALLSEVFHADNAAWIKRRYAGPVCSEWVASRGVKDSLDAFHPDFMTQWYVSLWGGTTGSPAYALIQAKTLYGWGDLPAVTDLAYETDMDWSINGNILRGATPATTGWTDVQSFYGGMLCTMGTTGQPDIWDFAAETVVTPAKLQVIHNMPAYANINRCIPALDPTNNTSPWWNDSFRNTQTYTPGTKTYFDPDMGATGGRDEICWAVNGGDARAVLSHSLRTPAQIEGLQQVLRVQALAIGSLPCAFHNRTTRTLVSYLPPERARVTEVLPTIWTGSYAVRCSATFTRWNGYDSSHIPGFAFYAAETEGTEFLRDLTYVEAVLPGMMCAAGDGFKTTLSGLNVGGVSVWSQTRSLGASIKAVAGAIALGSPEDVNWRLANALLDMLIEAIGAYPASEDAWRGSTTMVSQKMWVLQENDGGYKLWMHAISASGCAMAAAMVQEERVKAVARYFIHVLAVMGGGYNDVAGQESLWIGRPLARCSAYTLNIHPNEGGSGVSRRPFQFQAWGFNSTVTYGADGQTITVTSGSAPSNGYFFFPRSMNTPTGLTIGQKYFTRDVSGSTFKVSATSGGSAVSFTAAEVTGRGALITQPWANLDDGSLGITFNSGSAEGYLLQVMACLKAYLHMVEDDPRVRQATEYMQMYKYADPSQVYIEQAKWLDVEDI